MQLSRSWDFWLETVSTAFLSSKRDGIACLETLVASRIEVHFLFGELELESGAVSGGSQSFPMNAETREELFVSVSHSPLSLINVLKFNLSHSSFPSS